MKPFFEKSKILFDANLNSNFNAFKSALNKGTQKFTNIVNASNVILFRTSSVFPFDFFPDEISIDECKVNIVYHEFFLTEDIHSVTIDMIKDIKIEHGPFLATLKIVPDGYPGQLLEVHNLKRKDAIKARLIIQGLIVARKEGFDPAKITISNFVNRIQSLGSTHLVD